MSRKTKIVGVRLPEDLDSFLEDRSPPGGKSELIRRILQAYRRKWEAEQRKLLEDGE